MGLCFFDLNGGQNEQKSCSAMTLPVNSAEVQIRDHYKYIIANIIMWHDWIVFVFRGTIRMNV